MKMFFGMTNITAFRPLQPQKMREATDCSKKRKSYEQWGCVLLEMLFLELFWLAFGRLWMSFDVFWPGGCSLWLVFGVYVGFLFFFGAPLCLSDVPDTLVSGQE